MEDARQSPTVRRRRLARELRRLREAAGLTADEATRQLEWAAGKVNKLERAQAVRPRVTDIRAMLDLYGLTEETEREALLDLTREARQRGWWTAYGPLSDTYTEFESEARKISTFELSVIPGLLQTPAYARALQRGWLLRDEKEIDRLVELRMRRQRLLEFDNPPRLWAIIDESAVNRSFGSPETKREQLQRLVDTGPLEHVDIQILPTAAGFHPGLAGSFVILDYEQDPSLVYREISPSSLYLEGRDQVEERRRVFKHLSATALGPEESIAYLRRLAERS
ncbi:helix-turn-helix domain-containing protein [Actinoallomurus iriomotensis]|uniref:Transcriptional regulator n=1 Tax=Actinoallomurus iriomotensis TaxID=478107 RepID=A0A9W6VWH6_9ACTN|nr:helix-turn-helix transcriptional regulator [Actinoallomurus iriomotensis]GLY87818.1 transcriptional regulator [Actinoallomurus iriomotensis]